MIKVLVIDKHPVIFSGLDAYFKNSRNIKIVGHTTDETNINKYLETHQVDIILTEIELHQLNGITLIKRIKRNFPEIKLIVFTNQAEHIYGSSIIKAGASGFVSKNQALSELDQAILNVYNNAIYISETLAKQLTVTPKKTSVSNDFKKLSSRELEVLNLISSGKRNKEIAKQLVLNEKTVSTYKTRLMKKLNVSNIVELIKKAKQEF
jgi:two-component system response regulator FimZ (fimbrial Z protein)